MTSQPRILLIDDDPFVRDALAMGLGDAAYDVFIAASADEALALLDHSPADAIVTDMKMPGVHGGALIETLRARWPSLPIVAISGGGEIAGVDVVEVARESGADVCLVKPFRARDVVAALAPLLAARGAQTH